MQKIVLVAFCIMALYACNRQHASGHIVTKVRNTGNFTAVEAGGSFEVTITCDPKTSIVVEADDNVIDNIETKVRNNTLYISTRDNDNFNNATLKLAISASDIRVVKFSGASGLVLKNVLKNDNKIIFESSGASTITGEVDAPQIETKAEGASTINLNGRTKKFNAEASGSSVIKAAGLLSETSRANASGAANIYIYSSINLTADASGAATIYYKGEGNTTVNTSGAASVKKD